MTENKSAILFHKVPFRPAFEGHYLPTASYELRQAICTTDELDRLHSSSELRSHLASKRKAALKRHHRMQLLRNLSKVVLLVCLIAGPCFLLHRQPGLPEKVLKIIRGRLPFRHYTGLVDVSSEPESSSRQSILPFALLPHSVDASPPANSSKLNASMLNLTELTRRVLDADVFQTPLKGAAGDEKEKPEGLHSITANTDNSPPTPPWTADQKPKKGREAGWLVHMGRIAASPLYLSLAALLLVYTIVILKIDRSSRAQRESPNAVLKLEDTQAGLKEVCKKEAEVRSEEETDTLQTGDCTLELQPSGKPALAGAATSDGAAEGFEIVPSKSKKSKAGSGEWEEVDTDEASTDV